MADPFVAEIRIFTFNFAPKGWSFCNGQLLPISQNTALFSLLGTYYGGDGKSTFGLPNLQGNVPIGTGQGPGLSDRFIGETGGTPSVTLLQSEMPSHNHNAQVGVGNPAEASNPSNQVLSVTNRAVYDNVTSASTMSPQSLSLAGSSHPHNNMQPYLGLNYCIALQGVYPPRS